MREKNGEHPFGDAGQLICLGVFLMIWVADSFFLHKSTFLSYYIPLSIRISILVISFITAIYLSGSGHVVVRPDKRPTGLVTTGAFRYVRHPLYLASILTYLGLTISTASLFSLLLLAGISIFYDYIARYEEKILERKYGEEYLDYKSRTGKWIPAILDIRERS